MFAFGLALGWGWAGKLGCHSAPRSKVQFQFGAGETCNSVSIPLVNRKYVYLINGFWFIKSTTQNSAHQHVTSCIFSTELYYRRKRSLGQGNVFRSVYHSVHGAGISLLDRDPPGQKPLPRTETPWSDI